MPQPALPCQRSSARLRVAVVATAWASPIVEQAAAEHQVTSTAPEPDPIEPRVEVEPRVEIERRVEPRVEPGTCEVLVYTPPTASVPQSGELCVPLEANGEVVILVHGGGGYTGTPDATDSWRDVHLEAGRTTFTITYTLLDLDDPSDSPLWPLPEQNVKAAVQFIRSDETFGADSVVLHGFSAGARLAGIIVTTADDPAFDGDELWPDVSDAIDGAVLFYGYYDRTQFYGHLYYGPTTLDAAIAIEQADEGDAPVLIVHGTDDTLVPVDSSVEFADAMARAGVTSTLILVDGSDHAFDGYSRTTFTDAGAALIPDVEAFLDSLELAPSSLMA